MATDEERPEKEAPKAERTLGDQMAQGACIGFGIGGVLLFNRYDLWSWFSYWLGG